MGNIYEVSVILDHQSNTVSIWCDLLFSPFMFVYLHDVIVEFYAKFLSDE